MKHELLTAAATRSSADLVARLQFLAARSRDDTAEMVAHLAELEARRIVLAEGYGSLFGYRTTALHLSEHEAYNRVVAAQAAPRFPAILDGLADGSLNLTIVRLLAPHLTPENHRDVLSRAAGRSKREVEALVASLSPKPDVAGSVRRLPAADQARSLDAAAEAPTRPEESPGTSPKGVIEADTTDADPAAPVDTGALRQPPTTRPILVPLSPTRYRLQCTLGDEGHANLRLAQDLLRREIPSGDPGVIVERALALLVSDVVKKKTAATNAPGPVMAATSGSRHIPASVKRAVWRRDGGQCAFVARRGRRCTERAFLEFHHRQPFALGGEATIANISLRCSRHNAYEAELDFGPRVTVPAGRAEAKKGPSSVHRRADVQSLS